MSIALRTVRADDSERLAEIYRPYVLGDSVTLEYEPPSAAEFKRRIAETSSELPYIVAVADGCIVAYAYAHRYKQRFGYRFCAELSVYVAQDCRSGGIGKRLYGALIELCTLLGYTNLYGTVTDPNPASFALHRYFGFVETGREHLAGYKLGKWHDVVIFERIVAPHTECSDAARWSDSPRRFDELPREAVERLLEQFSEK